MTFKISELLKNNIKNLFNYEPIFDADTFCNHVLHLYNSWEFLTVADELADAQADLIATFNAWKDETSANYTRLFNAINTEYLPLIEFEKMKSGTIKDAMHKGHKESTATDIKTSNAESTTETPALITHDSSNNAYNGGVTLATREQDTATTNATRTRSAENNYTQKVGTATNNYKTVADIDGNTYDYNEKSFANYKESGHTTAPADLLEKEYALRLRNLAKTVINDFIQTYFYFVE